MQKEISIEQSCLRWVKKQGGQLIKQDATFNIGIPDRLLITHKGNMCFIEFKDPKGKLSRVQEIAIKKLVAIGVQVYICRSLDEFKEIYSYTMEGNQCN